MRENCQACRFWKEDPAYTDPNDAGWGFGSCRRHPPQVVSAIIAPLMPPLRYGEQSDPDVATIDVASASLFPVTHTSDWCGAFDPSAAVVPL